MFGDPGPVGPPAPKHVMLVYNQEQDQKAEWRVQVEYAQGQEVIKISQASMTLGHRQNRQQENTFFGAGTT